MKKFVVPQNADGKTLRQYLDENGFSSTLVKRYKFHGQISVNSTPAQVNVVLHTGDNVELSYRTLLATPKFATWKANVLFADQYLYVAEKPYGVPTHPDRSHDGDTLGNALATYFGDGFQLRIITRLDKTTSGLVLGALDAETADALNKLQIAGKISKKYCAEVQGVPAERCGKIELPLLRIDQQNKTVVDENGKYACTEFVVTKQNKNTATLWVWPKTGRTHQIRAHLAAIGHPICGDTLYGGGNGRVKLHCSEISFVHPVTNQIVTVTSVADY